MRIREGVSSRLVLTVFRILGCFIAHQSRRPAGGAKGGKEGWVQVGRQAPLLVLYSGYSAKSSSIQSGTPRDEFTGPYLIGAAFAGPFPCLGSPVRISALI